MTIYSGLFNSVRTNGVGDRYYDAWWFAKYFSTFIGNGVFPNPSTNLQVIANENMSVTVRAGLGWINGYFLYNDGDHVLTLDNADGLLKRIDSVVMRLNVSEREIEIEVKKGSFASTPIAPNVQRDGDIYELVLADVYIGAGTVEITQADITDTRLNKDVCGIVHGTVDQVDTTTIFNQYMDWLNQQKAAYEGDFEEWFNERQSEFDIWFATIQDILDGDVAGNLANRIASLETMLTDYEVKKVEWDNKADSNIREDTTKPLRVEVISSLPAVGVEGQVILVEENGKKKFKGYDGGKWV